MTRRKSIHVCCDAISCYFSSLACWVYRFWVGAYGKLIKGLNLSQSPLSTIIIIFFVCVGFYTCYTAVLWGSGCACYFDLSNSGCRDAHCCCNQVSYSKQWCPGQAVFAGQHCGPGRASGGQQNSLCLLLFALLWKHYLSLRWLTLDATVLSGILQTL